tara:strand:+ start:4996 stop:6795 length:1800 start_codon:yes stop_codon:yes gene_type:complete
MISIDDLSFEALRTKTSSDVKLVLRDNFKVPVTVYTIAQNQFYSLYYKVDPRTIELTNGTETYGQGYLIADNQLKQGTAFWFWDGMYSEIPMSLKEEVVFAWNTVTETGEEVTTGEDTAGEAFESLNDRGETVAEQRAREQAEAAQAEEDAQTRVSSTSIVYDESETIAAVTPDEYILQGSEGGQQTMNLRFVVVESLSGTVANTNSEYSLYRVQHDAAQLGNDLYLIQSRFVMWTSPQNPFPSLDAALQAKDDYVQSIAEPFIAENNERRRELFENQTRDEIVTEVEVFWKKSPHSFRQMALGDLEYDENALRTGREGEERQGGGVYSGGYGDALEWSENGNKLEIVDFDTPRVTTAGITENLSGAIAFTIKRGWKVNFTLKTNARLFTLDSQDELEGSPITVDGSTFNFTMYEGDRVEIDVDNERDGVYPFLITSNGYVWSSEEEIDDEVFLTMKSAEQLTVNYTKSENTVFINPPKSGQIKDSIEISKEEFPYVYLNRESTDMELLSVGGEARSQLTDEMQQSLLSEPRVFGISDIPAESSFVSPDDVVDQITPDIDVPDLIPDNWQLWLIGGIVAIGGFILLAVFINAKARSGGE